MATTLPEIIQQLQQAFPGNVPEILYDTEATNDEYNEKRQIFNTYFQFRPTAMVFCTTTEQVSKVMQVIRQNNYTGLLRVRSGGHDHEGESTGTDALVIDFSEMKSVTIRADLNYAIIDPGIRFIDLIEAMDEQNVGLPHGTCFSVRIAGFTFGGGWGPWTRQKGMGCESLAGVTIVLGDGSVKTIIDNKLIPVYEGQQVADLDDEDRKLLWALRGGGGMSYGVVTQLIYKTFTLPDYTTKFTVGWQLPDDIPPAVKILERWEQLIGYDENPDLLGTNLKIVAKPADESGTAADARHSCFFYGYYGGSKEQFASQEAFEAHLSTVIVNDWFPPEQYATYSVSFEDSIEAALSNNVTDGLPEDMDAAEAAEHRRSWSMFSAWDRVVPWDNKENKLELFGEGHTDPDLPQHYEAIPPEMDLPAPHKITSRLAMVTTDTDAAAKRREKLIESLESDLLYAEGAREGMAAYFTLGAITGSYYKNYDFAANAYPQGSAFPYKKCFYTIQYQAWWDNNNDIKPAVQPYVNRAMDWLEVCRDYEIPETYGAFISFKDSSIPTRVYFQESYDNLKQIKESYSQDPDNLLSSRKTII